MIFFCINRGNMAGLISACSYAGQVYMKLSSAFFLALYKIQIWLLRQILRKLREGRMNHCSLWNWAAYNGAHTRNSKESIPSRINKLIEILKCSDFYLHLCSALIRRNCLTLVLVVCMNEIAQTSVSNLFFGKIGHLHWPLSGKVRNGAIFLNLILSSSNVLSACSAINHTTSAHSLW